jgi:hypothetical protein
MSVATLSMSLIPVTSMADPDPRSSDFFTTGSGLEQYGDQGGKKIRTRDKQPG